MEHAAAMEVWVEFRDAHIPGLCFSDRPRHLSIPRERLIDGRILPGVAHIGIGDREMDESRWGEIDEYVRHLPFHGERDIVPAKWTYRDIIPAGHVHSIHDEPNPRYYGLDGCMIRQAFSVGAKKIARNYCDGFEARLCILFDDAPMNERQAAIEARLNHHLDHGGNPSAFLDYVETISRKWDEEPPLILTGSTSMLSTLGVKPLPDAFLLIRYMREWLDKLSKMPTTANPKEQGNAPPPAHRTLAERLDSVPGARKMFDTMLRIDGITNHAGQYVGKQSVGKGVILANWDAVVELLGVEGYGKADLALSVGLCKYIPGLKIDKRPSRLRHDQPYRVGLKMARSYVKEKLKAKE